MTITVTCRKHGHECAGIVWPLQTSYWEDDQLSAGQLAAMQADPLLRVEIPPQPAVPARAAGKVKPAEVPPNVNDSSPTVEGG